MCKCNWCRKYEREEALKKKRQEIEAWNKANLHCPEWDEIRSAWKELRSHQERDCTYERMMELYLARNRYSSSAYEVLQKFSVSKAAMKEIVSRVDSVETFKKVFDLYLEEHPSTAFRVLEDFKSAVSQAHPDWNRQVCDYYSDHYSYPNDFNL